MPKKFLTGSPWGCGTGGAALALPNSDYSLIQLEEKRFAGSQAEKMRQSPPHGERDKVRYRRLKTEQRKSVMQFGQKYSFLKNLSRNLLLSLVPPHFSLKPTLRTDIINIAISGRAPLKFRYFVQAWCALAVELGQFGFALSFVPSSFQESVSCLCPRRVLP